ncbi:MAG: hypothetical protein AAF587_39655 [Bacteroidota bacterium]
MKSFLSFFLSILLCFSAFSQENDFVSFGLEINPRISMQRFEQPLLATSGISHGGSISGVAYMNLAPGIEIKTGLNVSLIRIDQTDYSFAFPCDVTSSGFGNPKASWIHTKSNQFYVGMPISLKMNLSKKKSHPYISLGGEALVHLASVQNIVAHECGASEGTKIQNEIRENAPILFIANLGLGYECIRENKTDLYMGLVAGHTLNPTYSEISNFLNLDDGFNNSRILTLGIVSGIRFK